MTHQKKVANPQKPHGPSNLMRITLSLPAEDWDWLKAEAATNMRSMSSELAMMIRQARQAKPKAA